MSSAPHVHIKPQQALIPQIRLLLFFFRFNQNALEIPSIHLSLRICYDLNVFSDSTAGMLYQTFPSEMAFVFLFLIDELSFQSLVYLFLLLDFTFNIHGLYPYDD